MDSNPYIINSVLRAIKLLECFSSTEPALTNSQLAQKLGLNKSTITRLVYSLVASGWLKKNEKTGEFSLTYRIFQIGSVYLNHINFPGEARPFLSELASTFNETVHLAILNNNEVFYIDKVEGSQTVGMMSKIGNRSPAYCTGVGKIFLAYMNQDNLREYLSATELERFTPNTITDRGQLKRHLQRIRRQGYATDDSEHEVDIKCVAAPLFDARGKVVASISITGPSFRMDRERLENQLGAAIVKCAQEISIRLGYMGY